MFSKILIANRGEIACRVIRTARRMGIKTVAVYSDADKRGLHVAMADEAVRIGPPPSVQSYLRIDQIVEACRKTGAQAVHPGYGFLSENCEFPKVLANANIVFIGPDAHAIQAMGDKIESKKLAKSSGVSIVPGYLGVVADPNHALSIARDIGYPVMIKPSAGGGGKGMRVAGNDEQVREGFHSAQNEARSSFGDDRILIEKYIEQPRHIEIQVLADGQGTVLYLGERECSIQRRHQKIIEEAPSPFLDAATRKSMGEQAVALARAVDYKSAGTVEFIVDPERNFYFLEMNTRLQVEHPVTELITGLDLVELMIHIAAGEKLNLKQDDIRMNGWAIETRIYAEDPLRNFLPSTGRLTYYVPPPSTTVTSDGNAQTPADPQVRVDAGVIEGGEVSVFYDPMLAKLCTWGTTRDEATRRMREALDEYYIRGVSHNILFLSSLMANRRFIEGRLSTNFIAEEYPNGFQADGLTPILIAAATVIHRRQHEREMQISGKLPENKIALRADWVVVANGQQHRVRINPLDGSAVGIAYTIDIEGKQVDVRGNWQPGEPLFRATIDGEIVCVQVDRAGIGYRLFHGGAQAEVRVLTPHAARLLGWMPEITPPDMSKFVLSPMPGLLVSLAVQIGQPVKAGDTVAVIEAMKMANTIRAGQDGVVHKLHATPGTSIAVDQKIVEFA